MDNAFETKQKHRKTTKISTWTAGAAGDNNGEKNPMQKGQVKFFFY